jgi:hypothetical protein
VIPLTEHRGRDEVGAGSCFDRLSTNGQSSIVSSLTRSP